MKINFLLLLILTILSFQTSAAEQLTAKAGKNENTVSLLAKYLLHEYGCNVASFKKLNNLKTDKLTKGKSYKLPIKVYKYNGKSIRTTIGITDYPKAKRIQEFNEQLVKNKVKDKDYRKGLVLWVPQHEIECKKTDIKPATNFGRVFPIFGPKYQHVPLESKKLQGKVYYIVSGHGGPDPGAVYRNGGKRYCEDEYAYDIALRLARNLVAHGATAYMIVRDPNDGIRDGEYLPRDKDETCWRNKKIPLNQKQRLAQRAKAINKLYAYHKKKGVKDANQRSIMIHIDSRSVNKRLDLFFYSFPGSKKGKKFVKTLQKTIKNEYAKHQKNRGYTGTVKTRDLFMLRETKPTAAYIELGNIKNETDRKRFLLANNRQALANWLLKGLINEAK